MPPPVTSRSVVVRPSAKINLTLRVGARRADGFHDVRTLLQSIALHDTLAVTGRSGKFVLQSRAPGLPTDRANLVWRAAELLWSRIGRPGDPRDAHVRIEKQIPIAAGLGGGSADAAAALVALNTIWNARLTRGQLTKLASQIGSDVPFFLHGGTALGAGRGDELYPVDDAARFGVVIVKPSFGVATAEAYRWFDEDVEAAAIEPLAPAAPSPEVDLGWPSGGVALGNDLQASVARRHPLITDIVQACLLEGAIAAAMTGSGSAVFALFSEAVAPKAARRLQRPDFLVLVTRTLSRREAVRRIGL